MLDFQSLEGNGMTPTESMNAIVEAVQMNMIKSRFSSLFINEGKAEELVEMLLPSQEQKAKAIEILTMLSKRERQCFLMHTIENTSMQKIANELGISKSSVHKYIDRARAKFNEMNV